MPCSTALRSGRLAGAALDVVEDEHLVTADHALVQYARPADNLLLVPHIGGNTIESFEKTECFLADRVIEALSSRGFDGTDQVAVQSEGA